MEAVHRRVLCGARKITLIGALVLVVVVVAGCGSSDLTVSDVRDSADSIAKKDQKKNPDETYKIQNCRVTSEKDGMCDLTFFNPDGTTCPGQVSVTRDGDTITSDFNATCGPARPD